MSDSGGLERAAARGDASAFAALVHLHQGKLRAFLRRMTRGDHALADDLAQDTFFEAFRKIGQFRGEGTFVSWLLQIGYSRFLMHVRKHKLEPLEPEDETMAVAPEAAENRRLDLESAFAKIGPARRAALTLCFAEGYSHDEAARIMSIPLGTLKSHVARGREEMRRLLGGKETP